MSPRIIHILEAFAKAYRETGKEQPIMVIARYVIHKTSQSYYQFLPRHRQTLD